MQFIEPNYFMIKLAIAIFGLAIFIVPILMICEIFNKKVKFDTTILLKLIVLLIFLSMSIFVLSAAF